MAKFARSVRFTAPELKFLKAEADILGITVAELLRRIVDAYREGRQPKEEIHG